MKLTIALLAAIIFSSCSTQKCYPSKGSKDYATVANGKVQVWRKDYNGRILVHECKYY